MSSFLWTSMTCTVSKDSGKTPCTNDQLMIKLSGVDKILTLSLRMVTGTLNGPHMYFIFTSLIQHKTRCKDPYLQPVECKGNNNKQTKKTTNFWMKNH